jgi:putative transposase
VCLIDNVVIIYQAFRYELDPTNIQRGQLASHAGAARYAWNWGLNRVKLALEARAAGDSAAPVPNAMELHRMWNTWKKQPGNCSWWSENSKCTYQEAFRDLDRACKAYWRARRVGRRVGFPKFKKKGRTDHFRLNDPVRVQPRAVVLPRIGPVRTKEATTKLQGRILSATCRREADRWYVSLCVRTDRPDPIAVKGVAGRDALHKATTNLARTKSTIVLEDLHVAGLARNRRVARRLLDQGWAEFQSQLAYKTTWYGSKLLLAPPFYPSSRTCSGCGAVRAKLRLSERIYSCGSCGLRLNRDLNAARNLVHLAKASPQVLRRLETPVERAALASPATTT